MASSGEDCQRQQSVSALAASNNHLGSAVVKAVEKQALSLKKENGRKRRVEIAIIGGGEENQKARAGITSS